MGGQPRFLATGSVLRLGDHVVVGFPEVGVAMPLPEILRDGLPEFLTRRLRTVAHHIGDDLPGLPTQSNPNPAFVGFFQNK